MKLFPRGVSVPTALSAWKGRRGEGGLVQHYDWPADGHNGSWMSAPAADTPHHNISLYKHMAGWQQCVPV